MDDSRGCGAGRGYWIIRKLLERSCRALEHVGGRRVNGKIALETGTHAKRLRPARNGPACCGLDGGSPGIERSAAELSIISEFSYSNQCVHGPTQNAFADSFRADVVQVFGICPGKRPERSHPPGDASWPEAVGCRAQRRVIREGAVAFVQHVPPVSPGKS